MEERRNGCNKKEGKQKAGKKVERASGHKEGVKLVMSECKVKQFTYIVRVNIFLHNLQVLMS